ncbi:MAG: ABC transporter ATP-binding protein [Conexivisphaerales archaeon]
MSNSDFRLCLRRLTKVYGKGDGKKALDEVSFDIPAKGIFALIGRNGAGKTTLVRILATQLLPTAGSAEIDGLDVVKDASKLRQRIAIVPQEARTVAWMTPEQTVLSYLMWRGYGYSEAKKMAVEALAKVGIEKQRDILNRNLSGGTKRKVLVATVLASEADIIFLDEPTTGLDPISRRELWNYLSRLGKDRFTVLTTHYLEEAEQLADRIGILESGRLVGIGTLEELRREVKYQYSIRVQKGMQLLVGAAGEVARGRDGSVQLLTTEQEAQRISRLLFENGSSFSVSPVGLDEIFFHMVHREER